MLSFKYMKEKVSKVHQNKRKCIRCVIVKSIDNFPDSSKSYTTGKGSICKDCVKTEWEVKDCKEGDKLRYISPITRKKDGSIFIDDSQTFYFKRVDKNNKYCFVYTKDDPKGLTRVYIPYLRINRS